MAVDGMSEIAVYLPGPTSLTVFRPTNVNGHIEYLGSSEVVPIGPGPWDSTCQVSPLIDDVDADGTNDLVHVMTYGPRTCAIVDARATRSECCGGRIPEFKPRFPRHFDYCGQWRNAGGTPESWRNPQWPQTST